jgi:hypothetical protein
LKVLTIRTATSIKCRSRAFNRRDYRRQKKLLLEALRRNPKSIIAYKNLILSAQQYGDTAYYDSLTAAYRSAFKDNPAQLAELDRFSKAVMSRKRTN